MGSSVRMIVYNEDEAYAPELRAGLLSIDGVKIIAEVDDPILLPQAAKQFPADVAVINLDPNPELILSMAAQAIADCPDMPIFAISESNDGQLILSAMRSGVREFLTRPVDREILAEALSKISLHRVSSTRQGKLVSILGCSGGVGATSIATNLAVELSRMSSGGVALVDLDFRFGQVATMLDLESTYTISDLCDSHEQLEAQVIERALVKHSSGVQVLPRPNTFAEAETISAAHCVGVLSGLLGLSDYVVVDGPTRFDMGAKSVLDIADEILLVMRMMVPSVRNASRMLDGMRQVGFNMERVKLVCNRPGKESTSLSAEDIKSTLNVDLDIVIPDDGLALNGAINLGEPVSAYAPKSRLSLAYKELAERLHQAPGQADETEGIKKSGLFSKIFSDV